MAVLRVWLVVCVTVDGKYKDSIATHVVSSQHHKDDSFCAKPLCQRDTAACVYGEFLYHDHKLDLFTAMVVHPVY